MAKMNPGSQPAGSFEQGGPATKRSPGERLRMPSYVPPGATSAAQPLQVTAGPATLTMPRNRYAIGGPQGTR